MFSYRRDRNLRHILVHMSNTNQTTPLAGPAPCRHPRCPTCNHIFNHTTQQGPEGSFAIREAFTCMSSSLIYLISCRRCFAFYIGEARHDLWERFGEHLRSITKNAPGFPVAERYNCNRHSAENSQVRGVKPCGGNKQGKRQEMRLTDQH